MADEMSFELEEGEMVASVVNRPSSSSSAAAAAADIELRAQLREAATVLCRRGQSGLAAQARALVELNLHDATMWVLNDTVRGDGDPVLLDAFRHTIRMRLLSLQENGYDEHVISEAFPTMVLEAAQYAARLETSDDTHQQAYYRNGGFGAVPASAAAVLRLEKQTFRAAAAATREDDDGFMIMECSICLVEFLDGDQVSVMPCPSRVHKFHTDCISKWLAISNACPLCRHELPAYYE